MPGAQDLRPVYLVTGCAGFIGSHLSERLVRDGNLVVGVDCLTDHYPRRMKEENLKWLRGQGNFTFLEEDLTSCRLGSVPARELVIFHLAARPGVRDSWGGTFEDYVRDNILATQRLLEWAKDRKVEKFVYVSSSSVYGDAGELPSKEDGNPKPISPYGVTKLAAESLCYAYWRNFGIPVVVLRYFTVYGPRQRPDMAFYRFIRAILEDEEVEVYGDGTQTRDFTYVGDVVEATVRATELPDGEIFNVGSGSRISIKRAIEILEGLMGRKARVRYSDAMKGDIGDTYADISKIRRFLDYNPKGLEEGLAEEIEWLRGSG